MKYLMLVDTTSAGLQWFIGEAEGDQENELLKNVCQLAPLGGEGQGKWGAIILGDIADMTDVPHMLIELSPKSQFWQIHAEAVSGIQRAPKHFNG